MYTYLHVATINDKRSHGFSGKQKERKRKSEYGGMLRLYYILRNKKKNVKKIYDKRCQRYVKKLMLFTATI